MKEAVNPLRRKERAAMKAHGFKTMKAFKKWQKKERRKSREKAESEQNQLGERGLIL